LGERFFSVYRACADELVEPLKDYDVINASLWFVVLFVQPRTNKILNIVALGAFKWNTNVFANGLQVKEILCPAANAYVGSLEYLVKAPDQVLVL